MKANADADADADADAHADADANDWVTTLALLDFVRRAKNSTSKCRDSTVSCSIEESGKSHLLEQLFDGLSPPATVQDTLVVRV